MDPLRLFLLDQGIPVEYELDKFNTPHTGTTLFHPLNWPCRLRCLIPLRHLASTSSLGNIFWRHSASPRKNQKHKLTVTLKFISSNGKHDFRYILRTYLLRTSNDTRCYSQLYNDSISSLYFFLSPRGLQHKSKHYIQCCQLKTIIKTFRHLGISLLYCLTNLARKQLNVNTPAHVTTFPHKK